MFAVMQPFVKSRDAQCRDSHARQTLPGRQIPQYLLFLTLFRA